jgi:hypothetical protein
MSTHVKNVRSLKANSHHIIFYQASRNTVRDSYFYDSQSHQQQSYGIGTYEGAFNLVENNILAHITTPTIIETGVGNVFAYNFSTDDLFFDGSWAQGSAYTHAPGSNFTLWEGNDGFGLTLDNYHGTAHFITAFRNRWNGKEPYNIQQTVPVHIYSWNRYNNIIGNVLGQPGYHTNYEKRAGVDTPNQGICWLSIYAIGWGGNCENPDSGIHPDNDGATLSTLFRWGNYDTVTNSARFVASEVPSGLPLYANPVPSTQTLPASLYLPGKPAWWGSTAPWPSIGPDVTGGNLPNLGGHAHKIPARQCYESTPTVNGIPNFNATRCYAGASGSLPETPSNLTVQ